MAANTPQKEVFKQRTIQTVAPKRGALPKLINFEIIAPNEEKLKNVQQYKDVSKYPRLGSMVVIYPPHYDST